MIPQSLKIGHLHITVTLDTPDSTADGLADFYESKVYVTPGMPLNREQQVLLHECLHFVLDSAGVKQSKRVDALIDIVASGMCALLKDNKGLARYLTAERRRK